MLEHMIRSEKQISSRFAGMKESKNECLKLSNLFKAKDIVCINIDKISEKKGCKVSGINKLTHINLEKQVFKKNIK